MFGDSAYPLETFLLTPYKAIGFGATNKYALFNKAHASSRNVIERALGLLKGGFLRLMTKLSLLSSEEICKVVMAICILHNFGLIED